MDAQRIQDDEYEWQYYDFSSTNFIIQFKRYILDTIKMKIEYLESETLLALPAELMPVYRKKYATLQEEFKKVACAEIKEVEEDIRQSFAIPKHLLLPGENNDVPCPSSEIHALEEEIKETESDYKKKRALKYLLEKEVELVSNLEELLQRAENVHSKIKRWQEVNESDSHLALLNLRKDLLKKMVLLQSKHKYMIK
ncbi:hypothetical protein AMK59_328 [Oryctes borbonicus]|uniref:Protein MIS12 homolog n=1 Tax=Oryctes borbonicus TaxID=1629725 RepID=A0A0T6BDT8_9SCAR|nr:hypothetical protein AMK59_328 [Oryctes borbonicus]